MLKASGIFFIAVFLSSIGSAQSKHIGGRCEGCEAIYEYGNKNLTAIDTLPDYGQPGEKMVISGVVYKKDGKTPAPGVILYLYHTNQKGIYPTRGNESGWARRHGYIRGWVKTGKNGTYMFYTNRPGTYPSRSEPQHVHITVKEPGLNEYWIDSFHFDDDPLLTRSERQGMENRGGSGIVKLGKDQHGILICHRDIILGMNIPDYPEK